MNSEDQAVEVQPILTYDTLADKLSPQARLERMELYAEWLALPADLREPSSKKDIAKRLGVSYDTVKDYEQDPRFQAIYRDKVDSELRVANLGEIINSLVTQATDPQNTRSVQAARLLLEWMDKHTAPVAEDALRKATLDDIRAELQLRGQA